MLDKLIRLLSDGNHIAPILDGFAAGKSPFAVYGVCDGALAPIAAATASAASLPLLVVVPDLSTMLRVQDELEALGMPAVCMPPRPLQLHPSCADSAGAAHQRIAALFALLHGQPVVAPIDALLTAQSPPEVFAERRQALAPGDTVSTPALSEKLVAWGYERVTQVLSPGQFALRGDILDVYGPDGQSFRVELFGDVVESLRVLDTASQRSRAQLSHAHILGCLETPLCEAAKLRGQAALCSAASAQTNQDYADALRDLAAEQSPLCRQNIAGFLPLFYPEFTTAIDYCRAPFVCALVRPPHLQRRARQLVEEIDGHYAALCQSNRCLPEQRSGFCDYEFLARALRLSPARILTLQPLPTRDEQFPPAGIWRTDARAYPTGETDEQRLRTLSDLRHNGHTVCLCAGSQDRANRLRQRLSADGVGSVDTMQAGRLCVLPCGWQEGFIWPQAALSLAGADALGGKAQKATPRRGGGKSMLLEFSPGDYVVHDAHGIGVYVGLESVEAAGQQRDYLLIQYAGSDRLYVPTDQMHRVQRYVGKGSEGVKLSSLSGNDWNRTRAKVRRSVQALAFDLAALYAKREQCKGFAYSADTVWQKEFEEAFPYRETQDQLRCIQEIKKDMEQPRPMDRLLCGDVGYGKTEIAIRAAFKAAMDGKQTAILAPTTVLAEQHGRTLERRLGGFPVRCAVLSRLKRPAEQKQTLREVQSGQIDILVGTHRLLGKDVQFHDLGLLVVDEEQRFGVAHKERIKTLKQSVDVLTLSATPIPRTLHMSMIGVRDVSILSTPPEHRLPVQTYVLEYTDALAADAVLRETRRGGQVYFVYNHVQGIDAFAAKIRRLLPDVAIGVAHGQMPPRALESVMLDFYRHRLDVLLCSTIIESGLDIPNVNTLIVYDADRFGLAGLYQLRGRVGRSDKNAFAYFTFRKQKVISEVAQKRLDALCEFTGFGAGFKVAMRDLEIRGAGDILGAQQHGHMMEVGYDLYCRMLQEALCKVRAGDADAETPAPPDAQMLVDLPAYIPRGYIRDEEQKIQIYQRVATLSSPRDAKQLSAELIDRFGKLPPPVENLLHIGWVRQVCQDVGVGRLDVKDGEASFTFAAGHALSPAPLMRLLEQYARTAFLQPGEPTLIHLRKKTQDAASMLALAGKFALELLDVK